MNEASVYLLKQNNGTKEIFSNNFFLSTFESYHPLRENDPYAHNITSNYGHFTEIKYSSFNSFSFECNKRYWSFPKYFTEFREFSDKKYVSLQ